MAETTPWCKACRATHMVHCTDVWYGCEGMKYLPKDDERVKRAFALETDPEESRRLLNEVWNDTKPVPLVRQSARSPVFGLPYGKGAGVSPGRDDQAGGVQNGG